jgi:hypothetical protein
MWEPRRLATLWASTACYRDSFTFYLYLLISVPWVSRSVDHIIRSLLYVASSLLGQSILPLFCSRIWSIAVLFVSCQIELDTCSALHFLNPMFFSGCLGRNKEYLQSDIIRGIQIILLANCRLFGVLYLLLLTITGCRLLRPQHENSSCRGSKRSQFSLQYSGR